MNRPIAIYQSIFVLLSLAVATLVESAPLASLHVTRSVEINLKPNQAWEIVRDFSSLHHWHPGFANTELTQGPNGRVGAVRVASMAKGPRISDELLQYSEQSKSYRYRMVASSLPYENYVGTISVQGKGTTSIVTWKASFKRKGSVTSVTDADVILMNDHLVNVGLANLKRIADNEIGRAHV